MSRAEVHPWICHDGIASYSFLGMQEMKTDNKAIGFKDSGASRRELFQRCDRYGGFLHFRLSQRNVMQMVIFSWVASKAKP